MIGILTVLLTSFPAPGRSESVPAISPSTFQEAFTRALESRSSLPPAISRQATNYQYVFVGGYLNERMPGYFAINAKELHAYGIPRRAIHVIQPSSHQTIEENTKLVREKFQEIARSGPEKLVVIAHSKGACDVLAFGLQNPEFIQKHVHAMFLLQGPFGGTSVAEFVSGEGDAPDPAIGWRDRAVLNALGKIEGYFLDRGKHGGLSGLTPEASREFWSSLLRKQHDAIAIVGPKTFYITAATHPSHLRIIQRATGWYLQHGDGPNDGVVALRDQSLPGVGTVLASLDAGHSDLTRSRTSGRVTRDYPRALTAAILSTMANQDDAFAVEVPATRRTNQKSQRFRSRSSSR